MHKVSTWEVALLHKEMRKVLSWGIILKYKDVLAFESAPSLKEVLTLEATHSLRSGCLSRCF